jgi:hypothetical protein
MGREGLRSLEQREEEDRAKLEWLRAAAKEGFDAIDRGEYYEINWREERKSFLDEIQRKVSAKIAA